MDTTRPTPPAPFTVGFDLDMTLVDSRPGIKAVWDALSAETGVFVDGALAVTRLGPPLEDELAEWFPPRDIPAMAERYRDLYPDRAVTPSPALPGAHAALDAVHRHGGRAVVVTAKLGSHAEQHLAATGLPADEVVGSLWAEAKGEALRERGAAAYVGDHLGDVKGARTAGAHSVAVATGPIPPEDLLAAGADTVLADLTEFPAWLESFLTERAR